MLFVFLIVRFLWLLWLFGLRIVLFNQNGNLDHYFVRNYEGLLFDEPEVVKHNVYDQHYQIVNDGHCVDQQNQKDVPILVENISEPIGDYFELQMSFQNDQVFVRNVHYHSHYLFFIVLVVLFDQNV